MKRLLIYFVFGVAALGLTVGCLYPEREGRRGRRDERSEHRRDERPERREREREDRHGQQPGLHQ